MKFVFSINNYTIENIYCLRKLNKKVDIFKSTLNSQTLNLLMQPSTLQF